MRSRTFASSVRSVPSTRERSSRSNVFGVKTALASTRRRVVRWVKNRLHPFASLFTSTAISRPASRTSLMKVFPASRVRAKTRIALLHDVVTRFLKLRNNAIHGGLPSSGGSIAALCCSVTRCVTRSRNSAICSSCLVLRWARVPRNVPKLFPPSRLFGALLLLPVLLATFGVACAGPAPTAAPTKVASASVVHGLDVAAMDRSVAPGSDFFLYANGGWLKTADIPADRPSTGVWLRLQEVVEKRKKDILDEAAHAPSGSELRKNRRLLRRVPRRGGRRDPWDRAAQGHPRRDREPRRRARALGVLGRPASRGRRRDEQHALPDLARARSLGGAGSERSVTLCPVLVAGGAGDARPELLPRRVGADGGAPHEVRRAPRDCVAPRGDRRR